MNSDYQEIEDLAKRFASKLPNETNFNNGKSRKYFESKLERNSTFSSNDTLKFAYNSIRRASRASLHKSEKSIRKKIIKVASFPH